MTLSYDNDYSHEFKWTYFLRLPTESLPLVRKECFLRFTFCAYAFRSSKKNDNVFFSIDVGFSNGKLNITHWFVCIRSSII